MADDQRGKSARLRGWRRSLTALAVFGGLAVAGCATDPGSVQVGDPNIRPTGYREEILAYLRTYLNDPTGIRDAAISEPALQMLQGGPVGQGIGYGPMRAERYVVCVRFNAKNSSGRYEGTRDRVVLFLAGKLDTMGPARGDQCKSAAWMPFPELEKLKR